MYANGRRYAKADVIDFEALLAMVKPRSFIK